MTDEKAEALNLPADLFPVDRYEPLSLLGRGASGAVYLCYDPRLNRKMAVKTSNGLDAAHLFDFQREARATSRLNHKGIVKVFDCGVTKANVPFIAMEHLNGISLDEYLLERGHLELDELLHLFKQICEALEYAHDQGIYHRDLKPGNFILIDDGDRKTVRIIDFGIAFFDQQTRETTIAQGRTLVGTPLYMSPDQVRELPYDARSEIYSIGCILFRALTGHPVFEGDSALEIISLHASEPPPTLKERAPDMTFPEDVEKLVAKCLSKDRDSRFQTMQELSEALSFVFGAALKKEEKASESEIKSVLAEAYKPDRSVARGYFIFTLLAFSAAFLFVGSIWMSRKSKPLQPADPASSETVSKLEDLPAKLTDFTESGTWQIKPHQQDKFYTCRPGITDNEIAMLQFVDLTACNKVRIPLTNNLTGTGFKSIELFPIAVINLQARNLNDKGAYYLSRIKTLRVLGIGRSTKLTSTGIKHLTESDSISHLYLAGMDLPPDTMPILSTMAGLEDVGFMYSSSFTGIDLEALSSLPELKRLDISNTKIDSLDFVRKLPHLRILKLSNTPIADEQLDALKGRPLQHLDLSKTGVTMKGLTKLYALPGLRRLTVSWGDEIDRISMREWQKKLPYCQFELKN